MSTHTLASVSAAIRSRRDLADGTSVISATVDLPAGWDREQVTIEFIVPIAFPSAQPDCFYTDSELRLVGGGQPVNTDFQLLDGERRLWFSWHLASWTPSSDTIETYLRFVERRLHDPR